MSKFVLPYVFSAAVPLQMFNVSGGDRRGRRAWYFAEGRRRLGDGEEGKVNTSSFFSRVPTRRLKLIIKTTPIVSSTD